MDTDTNMTENAPAAKSYANYIASLPPERQAHIALRRYQSKHLSVFWVPDSYMPTTCTSSRAWPGQGSDLCEDPTGPAQYGIGNHPALRGLPWWRVRHTLSIVGVNLIDYVYEWITTGIEPDTRPAGMRRGAKGATKRTSERDRWTGITWDDVATAILIRAHAPYKNAGNPVAMHVDLDAPGGGAWPWERGGHSSAPKRKHRKSLPSW